MAGTYDIFFQQADATVNRMDKLRQAAVENRRADTTIGLQREQNDLRKREFDMKVEDRDRQIATSNYEFSNAKLMDPKTWATLDQADIDKLIAVHGASSTVLGKPVTKWADPRPSMFPVDIAKALQTISSTARTAEEANIMWLGLRPSIDATYKREWVDQQSFSAFNMNLASKAQEQMMGGQQAPVPAGDGTAPQSAGLAAVNAAASAQQQATATVSSSFNDVANSYFTAVFKAKTNASVRPLHTLSGQERAALSLGEMLTAAEKSVKEGAITAITADDIKAVKFNGVDPDLSDETTAKVMSYVMPRREYDEKMVLMVKAQAERFTVAQETFKTLSDTLGGMVQSGFDLSSGAGLQARRDLWEAERNMKRSALAMYDYMPSDSREEREARAQLRRSLEETEMPQGYAMFKSMTEFQRASLAMEQQKMQTSIRVAQIGASARGSSGGGGGGGRAIAPGTLFEMRKLELRMREGTILSQKAATQTQLTEFNKKFAGTDLPNLVTRTGMRTEGLLMAGDLALEAVTIAAKELNLTNKVINAPAASSSGGGVNFGGGAQKAAPQGPVKWRGKGALNASFNYIVENGENMTLRQAIDIAKNFLGGSEASTTVTVIDGDKPKPNAPAANRDKSASGVARSQAARRAGASTTNNKGGK